MELESIFEVILSRHREKSGQENVTLDTIHTDYLRTEPLISIIYIVVIVITAVIGLFGNILIIGAVCVHRKLRTTGNLFIVNLAIADLVVVSIIQPFTIIGVVSGPQFFINREELCHLVSTICVMSCASSMITLSAIALNRYIFVCKNKYYDTIYTSRTTPLMCIGIYLIVFLTDLPNFLGWGGHTYDFKTMGCSFDRLASLSYTLFLSITIYWIPFILVMFCYIAIYLYVRKTRKLLKTTLDKSSSSNDLLLEARRQENIRMVRTFFIVVVCFLLCWTPYDLLILVDRNDSAPKLLYVILLAIGHSNSSLNSILYGATNKRFRKGYKQFLCMVFCGQNGEQYNSSPLVASYASTHSNYNANTCAANGKLGKSTSSLNVSNSKLNKVEKEQRYS